MNKFQKDIPSRRGKQIALAGFSKALSLALLCVLGLNGCVVPEGEQTQTVTNFGTVEVTATDNSINPTASATEFSTTTPTPKSPTNTPTVTAFAPLDPGILQVCPEQRELSFGELLAGSQFNVIVNNEELSGSGIFTIEPISMNPSIMPNSNSGGEIVHYEASSPSGEWVAFFTFKSPVDSGEKLLEVIRFDGSNRTTVQVIDSDNSAIWISEDNLLLIGENYEGGPQVPLKLINPFTLEEHRFEFSPDEAYLLEVFTINGEPFGIFHYPHFKGSSNNFEPKFVLVNLLSSLETPILPWLETTPWFGIDPGLIYRNLNLLSSSNGFVSIVVEKNYGFDYRPLANAEDLISNEAYEDVMVPISIPGPETNIRIIWKSTDGLLFAFDRLDIFEMEPRDSSFYIFDAGQLELFDYCLDRGHAGRNAFSSPDGRFLAWTVYELDGGFSDPIATVILDTETGLIARLEGMAISGWIRTSEE